MKKKDFAQWVWKYSTRRQLILVYWWAFFNQRKFEALVNYWVDGVHFPYALKLVNKQ